MPLTQTGNAYAQVEAEKKAAAAAQEGTAKRLRDAEARVESLEETLDELRVAMDRQRAAADLRCSALPRCHVIQAVQTMSSGSVIRRAL